MPLHDWSERGGGWEGLHHIWLTELLRWVKPRLPAGYRAYIGSVPTIAVGAPAEKPDVSVRQWPEEQALPEPTATPTGEEPDVEIAVATLDAAKALYVELQGRLIAATELISPRNKDRPQSKATYLSRYVGYLEEGVHLLLVDVHRRPRQYSFADRIGEELTLPRHPLPPPLAISYCVGGPAATGGRMLSIWRRPLTVGEPLPVMELHLTVETFVPIDLEQTYMQAAADTYLA